MPDINAQNFYSTSLVKTQEIVPVQSRHLLIADNDKAPFAILDNAENSQRFFKQQMTDLTSFIRALSETSPDVIILDPAFGESDALDAYCCHRPPTWLGRLIVATTDRSDDMRLRCAKANADYLLYKPLPPNELPMVLETLLGQQPVLRAPDTWVLDTLRWLLDTPSGHNVELTYREVTILSALSQAPGTAIKRDEIILCMGFDPQHFDSRRMEILVRRLRAKIQKECGIIIPIHTVNSMGYSFNAPIRLVR